MTIESLRRETEGQSQLILQLKSDLSTERGRNERSTPSPMSTTVGNAADANSVAAAAPLQAIGQLPRLKSSNEWDYRCRTCGRTFGGVEEKNTDLIMAQEKVLGEIAKAKEELADMMRELDEKEAKQVHEEPEENVQKIFNIENMEALQELLEQAEESEQVLLFVDGKGNTWQLGRRADIDVGGEEEGEEQSPGKGEVPES